MNSRSSRRTVAAALSFLLTCLPLEPAFAAAARPLAVDVVVSQPRALFLNQLGSFQTWVKEETVPPGSPVAVRSAILGLALNPELVEPHRAAIAEHTNMETAAALDSVLRQIAENPELRSLAERHRARIDPDAADNANALERFFDHSENPKSGHIIVTGSSQVSRQITSLLRRLGKPVAVVADEDGALEKANVAGAEAVISASDDDMVNFRTLLQVRQANPAAVAVGRFFEQRLGQTLHKLLETRKVLAVSALSAPIFASSLLGQEIVASFLIDEESFTAGYVKASQAQGAVGRALSEFAADSRMFPIAVRENGVVKFSPDSAGILTAETELLLVGPTNKWRTLLGQKHRRSWRLLEWARNLKSAVAGLSKQTRWILGGLLVMTGVSIAYFKTALNLPWIDSVFFVVTTITSVAGGQVPLLAASTAVKIATMTLMVAGYIMTLTLISALLESASKKRLNSRLSERYNGKDHVIVAGVGTIGYRVILELLKLGMKVVAIEKDANGEFTELLPSGVSIITGDAGRAAVLRKANVGAATAIIAATNDDSRNVTLSLLARTLNPDLRTTARLSHPEFAREANVGRAIDTVISPAAVAAPTFVGTALHEDTVAAFVAGDHLVVLLHHHDDDPAKRIEMVIHPLKVR